MLINILSTILDIFGRYKPLATTALGLLIGFSVSSGLLFYSGEKLVNSLVYLGVVVALPFIFSFFSIFTTLFKKDYKQLKALEYSYLFGVFFSFGALASLLFIVTTQDLAFGWASTLDIKAKELSNFLNNLAIWKGFCSSCIIDEHLANISQFIRLGGAISKEQIASAKELGSWWKFIALSIIVYGAIFRAILFFIVKILNISRDSIKIVADRNEEKLEDISNIYSNKISKDELLKREFKAIGYHYPIPPILQNRDGKDIVVVVKSWEPPILDFFDYLEELQDSNKNSKISIYLEGLNGKIKEEDIDIWLRKLNELKLNYEIVTPISSTRSLV